MLTLFQVATGDAWADILDDLLRSEPDCDASPQCTVECCANPALTQIYFVTFVILAQFILLNVVVVLLNAVEQMRYSNSQHGV